ncbi:MAG: riboflavin biosynthesis protein RibF [Clostridia bacterium]|nr:riboflavin biosynthesis protein RibF [Clostridia bacterium]
MLKTIVLRQFDRHLPCVILLGGFDGLHLGHKRLVARAKAFGLPIGIMTIDDCKATGNLFNAVEREEIFAKEGIDFVLEMSFAKIKDLSPEKFIELLKKDRTVKTFVCGTDFRFGAGAKGNASTIRQMGEEVFVEDLLFENGEKVGVSLIKSKLLKGEAEEAKKLLGHPFFVQGEVLEDRKIGRTINFPTANIRYPKEKFPIKTGVYETSAIIDGKRYKGITNYGARPTFLDGEVWTETHFISYTGNLYGKTLKIEFERWLRGIEKFENAEQLKKQLIKDVRSVTEND